MYRVLLSRTGKAYAKECDSDDYDFVETIDDFVNSGDIILFCEDLDDLQDALGDKYEIKEAYGEE